MSKKTHEPETADEETRPEYDFSGRVGVRGKYYQQLRDGYTIRVEREDGATLVQHITNREGAVLLDPDVREYFSDAESVNTALRGLIHLIPRKRTKRKPPSELAKS